MNGEPTVRQSRSPPVPRGAGRISHRLNGTPIGRPDSIIPSINERGEYTDILNEVFKHIYNIGGVITERKNVYSIQIRSANSR